MDRLVIRDLQAECVIGVHDWERIKSQRIVIDVEVRGDFSTAAESDSISDAVDYHALSEKIFDVAEESSFRLVESLASRLVAVALDYHPNVEAATVAIHKPTALTAFGDAKVSVEVTRERKGPLNRVVQSD